MKIYQPRETEETFRKSTKKMGTMYLEFRGDKMLFGPGINIKNS